MPFRYRGGEFSIALIDQRLLLSAAPANAQTVIVHFRDHPGCALQAGERLQWTLDIEASAE